MCASACRTTIPSVPARDHGPLRALEPAGELQIACETTSSLIEHVEKNHLDVALVCPTKTHAWSEIVRTEPLHFVTSAAHSVHEEPVLPLAIGRADCGWRQQGIEALRRVGREHRILFTSWSAQIVTSAVLAGLAVSVLPECALRPGMRVLTEAEGFRGSRMRRSPSCAGATASPRRSQRSSSTSARACRTCR